MNDQPQNDPIIHPDAQTNPLAADIPWGWIATIIGAGLIVAGIASLF
jgi:hypothetical protein